MILASASPRRLDLLRQIGICPEEVIAPEIDETPRKQESPLDYALRMAREKAASIAANKPDQLILAADTVVACGQRILGKATDEAAARKFLELLSGRRHRVYTAVCLRLPDDKEKHCTVLTRVRFKRLHDSEIAAYLASGEWQDKAGGYAIQGRAAAFVPWINGSFSNVVGLPLAEVSSLLHALPKN